MVSAHGLSVVHGVECGHLVNSHWGHLQYPGDLIHDADAAETVLPLSEVEQWHNSRLLVLGWVSSKDFIDELLADLIELERDVWVVLLGVAVLRVIDESSVRARQAWMRIGCVHTMKRASDLAAVLALKGRNGCCLEAARSALEALLKAIGVNLVAIVWYMGGDSAGQ